MSPMHSVLYAVLINITNIKNIIAKHRQCCKTALNEDT